MGNMFDLFGSLGVKPRLCLQNVETTLLTIEAGRCDFHHLGVPCVCFANSLYLVNKRI